MDPYNLRKHENKNSKEKSSSPEVEGMAEYNPRDRFNCFEQSVNPKISSPSSTTGFTVSVVSVDYENFPSIIGDHSYSKTSNPSPSTFRNEVGKYKSRDGASKVAPIPSKIPMESISIHQIHGTL